MRRFGQAVFLSLVLVGLAVVSAASPAKAKAQGKARNSELRQKWLEKEVRHVLVMQFDYTVFDNLAFRVDGERVELVGQVVAPSLRSSAEKGVKQIEGVEQVVNKIEVLPLSPFDDRLRLELYRAIYGDGGLFHYSLQAVPPIHIIVKNGKVVLEGVVSIETDKNLASLRANGVPGIFSVTNHLRVE